MAVSLRAALLAVVLVTGLVPLAVLGYVELREREVEEVELARAAFENVALALAVRAEAAAQAGDAPLDVAASAAPGEHVLLVDREGRWRTAGGESGASDDLAAAIGDQLSGVATTRAPLVDGEARIAWARVPSADGSLVVVRPALAAVSPVDWTFLALLGFLGGGVLLVATAVTSLVVRPIRTLEAASGRLAEGAWDERVEEEGAREPRALARSFNRMAADLAHQHEQLQQLVEARTRRLLQKRADLAALNFTMAHEVREPVRAMRWIVDDMRERPLDDATEPLGLLKDRLDHLDRILLDLMRYEDVARRDAPVADVDLSDVVRLAAAEADVPVDVGRLPEVRANEPLLHEAFVEILRNARQHGQPPVRVQGAVDDEHDVVLTFDDEGGGVPPGRRDDALQLFQRLNPGVGSGVGLAIVRRVVERHGGRVQLQEAPTGGLRVHLRLPREGPPDAGPLEPRAHEEPARRF